MGTIKSKTKEQNKSLSESGDHSKVLEIIWVLIWAILIICVWYYSGKDYKDETIKNISIIENQHGDIR